MKDSDIKNQQFLAIMQSAFIEVAGSIEFEGEDQKLVFKEDPKAIIELYDADNQEQPIATQQVSYSRYFQFGQLPRKNYLLRVVPKRGAQDKRYEPTTFKTSEQGGFHKLELTSNKSKGKTELKRSGLFGIWAMFWQFVESLF